MVSNIEHLAQEFKAKLGPKTAAKRGKRMTSRKILKDLGKTKKSYKEFRSKLNALEAELERIESHIRECRDGVRSSRSQMLRMNKVLQNMDLADANYAIFYDSDAADVGYLIGGEEHHLDTDDEGEISLTLMSERRRAERADRAAARSAAGEAVEEEDEEDEDDEPEEEDEDEEEDEEEEEDEPTEENEPADEEEEPVDEDEDEEPEDEEDEGDEDDNESDDGNFIAHPNLRFVD